ncbi:MAG TPA: hypothetical protein VK724_07485 [Bryobacteraceae bacterium]|jgi:hypothetical protein|nr:hypothetical protein [Bryobacteraceae bacterium]
MIPFLRPFVLVAILATIGHAQWLNYPAPGTPRTPDGKPNLAAPAPRAADGKPDLSGVWMHQRTPIAEMKRLFGDHAGDVNVPGMEIETVSKYGVNILVDFKPAESPIRPEAEKIYRQRLAGDEIRPTCLPVGIPLASLLSEPFKIIQSPRITAVLYEDTHRQIYADGRGFPKEFAQPSWLGYSIGHWERDTFVVESAGFNDRTWLDVTGHPHSEALRITERYRRRDFGHLDDAMTFDDPGMYTKPFTIQVTYELQPASDIFEYFCDENEKDSAHALSK